MWRSDTDKVKKILDSIAQEPGKRRLKLLQRLEKIGAEDINLLKETPQVLFSCITDEDEEVWRVIQDIIKDIMKKKPEMLMGSPGALAPHLRQTGRTRKRALVIIKDIAQKKKVLIKSFIPVLMKEVTTGDKEETELMTDILMLLGINAKEYIKRVKLIEHVLEVAKNSGADITDADKVFEEAKSLMVSRGINDFLMGAKKAELMARYAKKVSVTWRDLVERPSSITISNNGRFMAVGLKNEVLLYSWHKEILWRFTVEGNVSALVFMPDNKTLLIGTSDRVIYMVNQEGAIQWKRRRGGAVLRISVTESTQEIFTSTDDSNVSILNLDGVDISRQWTEKPAVCLGITDDGKTLVLTMGDHNIISYDKNMFQRWKYMGGIWTDLAVSRNGNYILGGTQGGDVVCLSNSGVPIWKKNVGGSIKRVFVNPETDCFIAGTREGLFCYDKAGKHLWSYMTKEPLLTFDTTRNGETLFLATDKSIYLLENREVYKHYLYELRSSLKTMGAFGIDVSGVEDLIQKANSSFANNDYKQGAKFVSNIKDLIEDAKLERGSELLVLAEKTLSDSKAKGVEVSEGISLLHRAENLINRGDFDGAILEAKHALDVARKAETAKERTDKAMKERRKLEVRKVIDVAVSLIDEADAMGIDTTEPEEHLQAAITAADEGEFDQCIYIVRELDEELKKKKATIAGQTEASYATVLVLLELKEPRKEALEKAIKDITRAVKYYESKQSMSRVGECWEILAKLEKMNNNLMMSRLYYQRSINTYFKIGELEKVAKIIMTMMKELEGDEGELPVYEVEDAFLIFRDGRLIGHHTMRLRPEMDREILGGMLVAIQNFVEDSLMATGTEMLNELRYGKTKILIQRGRYLTLALVITGSVAKDLWKRMQKLIDDVERRYDKVLSKWDGDMDKLWGVKKLFEQSITQI